MNKPDQIIDEISGVIYPPSDAIISQLNTIRAIIPPTAQMYEETEDIHTILPNLEMIQIALNYLRGLPPLEFPPIEDDPEDKLDPRDPDIELDGIAEYWYTNTDFAEGNVNNIISITIIGKDVEAANGYPELFGEELPPHTTTATIKLPVEKGKKYHIKQINSALEFYKDDPTVSNETGRWTKNKDYEFNDDDYRYGFLIPEGRELINILVYDLEEGTVIADYHIFTECDFVD